MNFFTSIFVSLFLWCNASYLQNTNPAINYYDVKTGGAISTNNIYPYVGFGCIENYKNDLYAVTSSQYPTHWIRQHDNYKCTNTQKKVEIMKYKTLTHNHTRLLNTSTAAHNSPPH